MIVGYCRVADTGLETAVELDALNDAGCDEIFRDVSHEPGSPELKRALDTVSEGDTLVVWKFERFGRSLKQLMLNLRTVGEKSVRFVSVEDGIDTAEPAGEVILLIVGLLFEIDRRIQRDIGAATAKRGRPRGKEGGRRRVLTDENVVEAKRLYAAAELTVEEIAARFGVSRSSIYRCVRSG